MNEWKPIETAPKDRPVLILEPREWSGKIYPYCASFGKWVENDLYKAGGYWAGDSVLLPSHWMEIGGPPKDWK